MKLTTSPTATLVALTALTALAPLALGCSPGPVPPEDSGVVPPIVDASLPADYHFRWPVPATVLVSVRSDMGLGASVARQTVELAPPDATGARQLSCSSLEPIGGHGAATLAMSMSLVLGADAVMVSPDGDISQGEGARLWGMWVSTWRAFAPLAPGQVKKTPGSKGGQPDGMDLEFRNEGPGRWPGSEHLVMNIAANSEAGRAELRKSSKVSLMGDLIGVDYAADVDPRTLEPLKVTMKMHYADRELPLQVGFEFDWSITNAVIELQRRNEDVR